MYIVINSKIAMLGARAWHHHGSDTPTSPRAILHHTDAILYTFLHTTVLKVRFTQKMLEKLSHHHSSEHFFAPGLLFPVNGMNSSDKMSIFSFFCINQISLLKLIQICTYVIINNFLALQAL